MELPIDIYRGIEIKYLYTNEKNTTTIVQNYFPSTMRIMFYNIKYGKPDNDFTVAVWKIKPKKS